jgi:hypothetical protein
MDERTIDIRGSERVRMRAPPAARRCWRRWNEPARRGRSGSRRVFASYADELTPSLLKSVRVLPRDVFVIVRPADFNIEATIDRMDLIPSRLRRFVVEDHAVLDRLTHASRTPFAPGYHAVIRAWRDGPELVCVNERFDEIRIPDAALRRVSALKSADLSRFEVSSTGSFIHWPDVDAHMGWSQLLALVDETEALRQQQESADFNRFLGQAIRRLRESRGLDQSSIPGLTDRHLRRIESGEQRATVKALESLARAHRLTLSEYIREVTHE